MKQRYLLLSVLLAAAIALFGVYLFMTDLTKDTTAPVITVDEGILEISVEDPGEVLMTGVTALDDRDGDVTATMLVESVYGISDDNVTTVTYAAFDRAGNVSKIQREVRYTDYREPRFELFHSLCFPKKTGFALLEYVGASDVLEGDIRRRVRATLVSDTRNIDEIGTHVVRFQVTNSMGDTVVEELPVEIYNPEWYTADVVLDEYLIYLKQGDVFRAADHLRKFVVPGEEIDISRGVPNDIYSDIRNNVNTRVPGVYTVEYTLTKTINQESFSGRAVLVVIVQE